MFSSSLEKLLFRMGLGDWYEMAFLYRHEAAGLKTVRKREAAKVYFGHPPPGLKDVGTIWGHKKRPLFLFCLGKDEEKPFATVHF